MDLRLGATDGIDALVAIRGEFPQARVIILTTSDGDVEIQRALRAGAFAYVLKSAPKNELLAIIRSVHGGRRHVPAEVAARLAEFMGEDDLTPREIEVLGLIRDGNRNKEIASRLSISETTVNFHIKNIVDKLRANDRTHAVTIALRRGLLQI
jgi:DNA-binding NarL/FixJ family response regulator